MTTIYIYDGADLTSEGAAATLPTGVIDLAQATTALCVASTGANPVRPHMLFFNATHSHAILAFVVSGHVVIFDAAARTPLACLRTSEGAGGARQTHAAIPASNGAYILVANQNGKRLERIRTDYATNIFSLDPEATLDLLTCTTPNGVACEAPDVRPDNAPICPILESSSTLAFVTLRGRGPVRGGQHRDADGDRGGVRPGDGAAQRLWGERDRRPDVPQRGGWDGHPPVRLRRL